MSPPKDIRNQNYSGPVTRSRSSSTPPKQNEKIEKTEKIENNKLKRKREEEPPPWISDGPFSCVICMNDVVLEKGILNMCTHEYCFECIYKWSEFENTCPQCKKRFTRIIRRSLNKPFDNNDPQKKKHKHAKSQYPSYELIYTVKKKNQKPILYDTLQDSRTVVPTSTERWHPHARAARIVSDIIQNRLESGVLSPTEISNILGNIDRHTNNTVVVASIDLTDDNHTDDIPPARNVPTEFSPVIGRPQRYPNEEQPEGDVPCSIPPISNPGFQYLQHQERIERMQLRQLRMEEHMSSFSNLQLRQLQMEEHLSFSSRNLAQLEERIANLASRNLVRMAQYNNSNSHRSADYLQSEESESVPELTITSMMRYNLLGMGSHGETHFPRPRNRESREVEDGELHPLVEETIEEPRNRASATCVVNEMLTRHNQGYAEEDNERNERIEQSTSLPATLLVPIPSAPSSFNENGRVEGVGTEVVSVEDDGEELDVLVITDNVRRRRRRGRISVCDVSDGDDDVEAIEIADEGDTLRNNEQDTTEDETQIATPLVSPRYDYPTDEYSFKASDSIEELFTPVRVKNVNDDLLATEKIEDSNES